MNVAWPARERELFNTWPQGPNQSGSSDTAVRRNTRCQHCGTKGATIQLPDWFGIDNSEAPFLLIERARGPTSGAGSEQRCSPDPDLLVAAVLKGIAAALEKRLDGDLSLLAAARRGTGSFQPPAAPLATHSAARRRPRRQPASAAVGGKQSWAGPYAWRDLIGQTQSRRAI